jgi:hypothetical protein
MHRRTTTNLPTLLIQLRTLRLRRRIPNLIQRRVRTLLRNNMLLHIQPLPTLQPTQPNSGYVSSYQI